MPDVTVLTESQLRALVPLDADAVRCVANAFAALATKPVVMPPILRLDIAEANGEVDVKTAYVPGIESFAIKISPGFFDNPKLGLPSVNGLMALLSARTGLLEAMLLDNGYLTDVRTAAAGAVAADHLARSDAGTVAILGAGVQARLQLQALTLVRKIEAVTVWARDPEKAQEAASWARDTLEIEASTADTPQAAIAGADIVVTTTPASAPLIEAGWLEPGQHLTAMGSDAEHKNEIDPTLFARPGVLYVPDRLSQTRILGELHHAIAAGTASHDDTFPELGTIVAGGHPGRTGDHDITFADLTGTGVQDTAIATLARERARASDAGTTISS